MPKVSNIAIEVNIENIDEVIEKANLIKELLEGVRPIEAKVNMFFENKNSFLVTEAIKIYLNASEDDIKLKALELLNKIK